MNVAFYVPNLIDYLRIILLLFIPFNYQNIVITTVLFFFVFALDGIDGKIARKLQQTSIFGDMLDLFTDLASELILLMILVVYHPHFTAIFIFLALLTLFGHFSHVYLAAFGEKKFEFRKQNKLGINVILKKYLDAGLFMTILQVSWYCFLYGLYLNHFYSFIGIIMSSIFFIPFFLRVIVLFFMLVDSYYIVLKFDNQKQC